MFNRKGHRVTNKVALPLLITAFSMNSVSANNTRIDLPLSSPEAQGLSSKGIREFVEAANESVNVMHSFMVVRHGHVVAGGWWKPEGPDKPHVMWSLSKSFTSTAVGMAVADGKLDIDERVLGFFPEYAPANPSQNLQQMSVRDLLSMTTGHETEPRLSEGVPWEQTFLAHPVLHTPGTHFLYNSAGSHMLSSIVQKVTGQTMLDFLRPRLFEPLGIQNPHWEQSPQGTTIGGWGLHIRTEDIARFGQLYLQKGTWNDTQLVPQAWVEAATSKQVSNGDNPDNDWNQGYGFQFWRCRHNAFRGDGKDGQFCVVLPELDAVVAMTAHTNDLQGQLALVWDKLLPAFHDAPLPANEKEETLLKETVEGLAVPSTQS